MVVLRKVDVFGQKLIIRAKVLVMEKKWFHSGKSGCNRAKWSYSNKLVVVDKSGCIRAKVVLFGQ